MENSTLDRFCGSTFWDMNKTWNTADPDLTICFEKTVLVWVPCAFLFTFTAFDVYCIVKSKDKNIPWTVYNVSKLGVNCALIVLSVVDLGVAIHFHETEKYIMHNVYLYTPVIEILKFTLAAVLLIYNKKHGIRTSGLLFLFWALHMLCSLPQLRTEIRLLQSITSRPYYFCISFCIYFGLLVIMFLLNCFVDAEPRISEYPKSKKPWPEKQHSHLSRLFFIWFDPLAWKGFRKPLKNTDLWDIKMEDSCKVVVPLFKKHWKKTLQKFERTRTLHENDSADVDFIDNSKKRKKHASVLPALAKCFGATLFFCTLLKLSYDILMFVSPKIVGWLINFVKDNEDKRQWKGYFYAILLFLTPVIQTMVLSQYFCQIISISMHIRTAFLSAIYRKAMRMSNTARNEFTVGEIMNVISVDTENIVQFIKYINEVWSVPLQIVLAVYFLWEVLGPSVLAGLAIMILLIPVNIVAIAKAEKLEDKLLKNKDERVKLMNEILSGIKVLKLYAWEPSFEDQVLKIRAKEMKVLKETAYLHAAISLLWSCAIFLVTLASFATFVLVDEKNILDAKTAFVSLTLFDILRSPFYKLPSIITSVIDARVSLRRIDNFLNCNEVDPKVVSHDQEDAPLIINNGNFHWGEGPVLKNINLRFTANSLTAIVGSVGSGKSSLVSAFLGEMEKTSGRVNTLGSIAYVAQQAWIQNATLRQNILFGKKMNRKLYERVIEACALKPDFEILPGGDQTEIGERGINLSGGQKQRISLARAVYANSDIYFLDDPLSAVDSQVGKHIFEEVIGPHGLLKGKTRVLVTHVITYLPQTDKIVVLTNGEVSESGTYQDLLNNTGAFAEFLTQHMNETAEEVEDDGLDKMEKHLIGTLSETIFETGLPKQQKSRPRFSVISDRRSRPRFSVISDRRSRPRFSVISDHRSRPRFSVISDRRSTINIGERSKLNIGERLIEVEKEEMGRVKWDVYKQYLKYIGWGLAAAAVLFNMIVRGFSIGSDVWLSVWSTDVHSVDTAKRNLYLGVYAALGLGQCIATFFMDIALFIGCWYAAKHLHEKLLKNVMRNPLCFFDVTPIGRILSRFSGDVAAVDVALVVILFEGLNGFFEVLATLFVITFTTPIFAVVIIPLAILYYFIQRFYVPTSRQLKRLQSISLSPIYSHFSESVTGAVAIRAFKEEERFINEAEAKIDCNQLCYYLGLFASRWLSVRLEMMGNLIILSAAIFAVIEKDKNAGLVGLSVNYSLKITYSLNWLVRMISSIETNIVSVERIKEYLETPQEAPWEIANKTPPASWPENGTIEFKNYAMRYREGLDFVLKSVNFFINGGEKVGIVGRTGAGKSSLTLALFRIIEAAEGEIIIDGYNISELGLHALRSRLTILPQDAVLFSGSLRMNIDPFDNYSDEEVWTALEQANLKSFVKGLPAGLDYEVAPGGGNLSVGQRQLICLSRALLRKTKVLILDEATAAVDLETDDLIQRTIRKEFRDCTVLTIAHRLNTIMDSDRVMVLDKGQIAEFDSPQNLLEDINSIFYNLCKDAGIK